ncbi:MAG: hypothetical protein PVI30_21610 [Myxococcales bacterium]
MHMPRIQTVRLLLLTGTLLLGCSRSSEPAPEPTAEPTPAPAPAAPADQPAAAPAKAQPQAPGNQGAASAEEDAKEHMWGHYVAALKARDAVIGGDAEAAREPLQWLASHAYPESLPEAWLPEAANLQRIASRAAEASDGEALARAIGQLGAACGECHAAMNQGPSREPTGFDELSEEDLKTRMHRHGWAMERMWEGLVTPWDASYRVGAQVLAEGKLALEKHGEGAKLADGLSAVRALGRQAATLEPGDERPLAYGDLIATCADCHRAQEVKLKAIDAPPAEGELPDL